VIVIPSFNNEKWCEKNILSALNQNYDKFRIIFTDDCSTDKTFKIVKDVVKNHKNKDKVYLVKNKENKGALHNLYDMIYSCDDDEIIMTLDGDDWLAHNDVISKLNEEYCKNDIWMLNSQHQNSSDGSFGCSAAYPDYIKSSNSFRSYAWGASHLRTFYTWLFKSIKKEDMLIDGKFASMTWDMLICFSMLEMSGMKSKFIPDIMYIYNTENEISDHRKDRQLQASLDRKIRAMPKYTALKAPILSLKNVGVLLIATNKYTDFLQQMISSADEFFLKDQANITYYVFSDKKVELVSNRNIEFIEIKHKKFPYASMDRFKHFINNKEQLLKQDYLYYFDVDCKFVSEVNCQDVYADIVGVSHCGYFGKLGPTETNQNSQLYLSPDIYKRYYGGGMSGGKSKNYIELSEWCFEKIENDVSNGIIPLHHDETAINTYFALNEPDLILSPSYHYPMSNLEHYKTIWGNKNFKTKLLLLDKNHEEVRS